MKKVLTFFFDADSLPGKIICSLLYIVFYDYMYKNFVYELFSYIEGLDYIEMTPLKFISWIVISVLPMLTYHRINNVSTFLCFFLYLFVYIPFIHGLFTIYGISNIALYSYTGILCLLFLAYFSIGKYGVVIKNLEIRPSIPFIYIECFTIFLTIVFIAVRASSMHFVNIFTQLDLLYAIREDNSEDFAAKSFILYIQGWLSGAFYPFLLVCYLRIKSRIKTILVLLGYLLLFMADMQKITFLMPFVLIGFYYLIKIKEQIICSLLHSYFLIGLSAISIILFIFFDKSNEVLFTIISIVLLRTVCVAGWLTQNYYHFFTENPYTYYSHINIINAVTNMYPYDRPLGIAVSYGTQNANANLFLTDGIAACGIFGFIFIGIVFMALMYLINAISYRYMNTDLLVIFLPSLAYMLNVSLFTTLLSAGMAILIILLMSTESPIIISEEK